MPGASSRMLEQWVWLEPLSAECLLSSRRQDQACSHCDKVFPPVRASACVTFAIGLFTKEGHTAKTRVNRQRNRGEGQNHIAQRHACREARTNWRLLLQQFVSDNEENPASNALRSPSQLKK